MDYKLRHLFFCPSNISSLQEAFTNMHLLADVTIIEYSSTLVRELLSFKPPAVSRDVFSGQTSLSLFFRMLSCNMFLLQVGKVSIPGTGSEEERHADLRPREAEVLEKLIVLLVVVKVAVSERHPAPLERVRDAEHPLPCQARRTRADVEVVWD